MLPDDEVSWILLNLAFWSLQDAPSRRTLENTRRSSWYKGEIHNGRMAEWYRMRSQTKAMAYIQKTILSFEYASVAISALFYYQKTIKPKDPVLFYSITMGAIFITASCSAVYGGRFVDRTGRLRAFSILVSIFSIVGNIIYSVPYSKWFPILGRSLCGISPFVWVTRKQPF